MKAKFINEDLNNILKSKFTQEDLDKMSIKELVILAENKELVTLEGYGGENKLGFIPVYIDKRLRKEGTRLENSNHVINTWDTYSLYRIPGLESPKCVMRIDKKKTRGLSVILKIVNYKAKTEIFHYVDYGLGKTYETR